MEAWLLSPIRLWDQQEEILNPRALPNIKLVCDQDLCSSLPVNILTDTTVKRVTSHHKENGDYRCFE